MMEAPQIKPGQRITVEKTECIVKIVYPPDSSSGAGLVVFNKKKPTTHDVEWDGEKWIFPKRPDFGGYANDSDPFVQQLKRGK